MKGELRKWDAATTGAAAASRLSVKYASVMSRTWRLEAMNSASVMNVSIARVTAQISPVPMHSTGEDARMRRMCAAAAPERGRIVRRKSNWWRYAANYSSLKPARLQERRPMVMLTRIMARAQMSLW
jgi:hypothetical protein